MNPAPSELRKDIVLRAVFSDWLEERMETDRAARVRAGCFCDGEVVEEYPEDIELRYLVDSDDTFAEVIEEDCHFRHGRDFFAWWRAKGKIVFVAHGDPNCLLPKPEFEELIRIASWGGSDNRERSRPGGPWLHAKMHIPKSSRD